MKITLLRHLKTEYNNLGIIQGRRDIPVLSPEGSVLEKIHKNMETIDASGPFDHILASRLKRTRMTAEFYRRSCTIEPLLDELDFGRYEGMEKKLLEKEQPLWTSHPEGLTLGEPLMDLKNRIMAFLEKYSNSSNILIFGHGAWTRALISWINHGSIREMNRIDVSNNEIVQLEPARET